MENKHRKIKGYRELTQQEINLMNRIKEKSVELKQLIEDVDEWNEAEMDVGDTKLIIGSESRRWTVIAKTNLQQGLMALTRAVAKPVFF